MPKTKEVVWSLYIIKTKLGTLYTGITTDVKRRFEEHNSQGPKCAKYLKGKAPLKLIYNIEVGSKSEATKLELEIKSMSKKEKNLLIAE